MDENMASLVGKVVTLLENIQDGEAVRFTCSDGTVYCYEAIGDCCSRSWFYDFIGVDCLLNNAVVSTKQVNIEKWWENDAGEKDENGNDYVQQYSIEITTGRGVCEIVYRNSSNGYYGGWCELVDNYPGDAKVIVRDT